VLELKGPSAKKENRKLIRTREARALKVCKRGKRRLEGSKTFSTSVARSERTCWKKRDEQKTDILGKGGESKPGKEENARIVGDSEKVTSGQSEKGGKGKNLRREMFTLLSKGTRAAFTHIPKTWQGKPGGGIANSPLSEGPSCDAKMS